MFVASRTDRTAWSDAAYDVAWRILHDREAATAAAVEGMQVETVGDEASAVLITTRRAAIAELEERHGRRPSVDDIDGVAFVHASDDDAHGAERAWGAAEAMGPVEASLVDLHLRFGVPAELLAADLDVSAAEAPESLRRLRGRLEGALASWRLWRDGKPRCDELGTTLAEVSAGSFGPATGRHIAKHAVGCHTCRTSMTTDDATSLDAFIGAPVLRAPAPVAAAAPRRLTSSVFVDAQRAAEAQAPQREEPTRPPVAEPTDVLPITPPPVERTESTATGSDDAEGAPIERRRAAAKEAVAADLDDGGPGILAGIALGLVIAVLVIAGITAWVITSA